MKIGNFSLQDADKSTSMLTVGDSFHNNVPPLIFELMTLPIKPLTTCWIVWDKKTIANIPQMLAGMIKIQYLACLGKKTASDQLAKAPTRVTIYRGRLSKRDIFSPQSTHNGL